MNKGIQLILSGIITSTAITAVYFNQSISKENVLKVGAIPDQKPEQLNRLYELLSKDLHEKLNVKVRYIPVTSYPAAVSAFRTGSLDLVWFGGLTGLQARQQTPGSQIIAQRDIDARFYSVFIANTSSKIKTINKISGLSTLKGKRFTFGSESSTSGRLMPQYFLQQAKVKTTDFKGGRAGFSGSHDATLALVQSGSYDAGALNSQVWLSNLKRGRVNTDKVKVIWKTPTYMDYHWVARGDLENRFGRGFLDKIKVALTSLNFESKKDKRILDLFGAKKFIPAYPYQYQKLEKIGKDLGKLR